jgi:hypothetical protein
MAELPFVYTKNQIVCLGPVLSTPTPPVHFSYSDKWYRPCFVHVDSLGNQSGRGSYNKMEREIFVFWYEPAHLLQTEFISVDIGASDTVRGTPMSSVS